MRQPTLFDRAVAAVSPEWALNREKARMKLSFVNSGYSQGGASHVKRSLRGANDFSSSPDEDITWNLRTLRHRCRSMYMCVPLATGAIKTARTNVVGAGLVLKPCLDANTLGLTDDEADKLEREIELEWNLFANTKDCSADRRLTFGQIQRLAFLSQLMNGDVFVLPKVLKRKNVTYDLCLDIIEADRVCNENFAEDYGKKQGGIEVDESGAPVNYFISKFYPQQMQKDAVDNWVTVPAFGAKTGRRNVYHMYDPERPQQRRGVPFLAPVIESLKQLGRYSDAELMAAVISGMFSVAITSDSPDAAQVGEMATVPMDPTAPIPDATASTSDIALGNGAIFGLAPGESVQVINPSRPNAQFDPFVTSVMRQVGAGLEIPVEIILKHFQASYSASRAALLEAWKLFKPMRQLLVEDLCKPVYEEWFTEAVAKGRINAPGFFKDPRIKAAYLGSEWTGPAQGQVDPEKEVTAAKERVNQGFSTRAKETAELTGMDFMQNLRQRIKEEKLMREGGLLPIDMTTEQVKIQDNVDGQDPTQAAQTAANVDNTDNEANAGSDNEAQKAGKT